MATVSLKQAPLGSLASANKPERRHSRRGPMRRLVMLAVAIALVYFAPSLLALTPLRDLPLQMVFEGIDGTIQSGGASFGWFSSIEYREVQVDDGNGDVLLRVPRVSIERTGLQLLFDRSNLGTVTVREPELHMIARADRSNLEDVLLPWWNRPSSGPVEIDLIVVEGAIALEDHVAREQWKISAVAASLGLSREEGTPVSWSAAGKIALGDRSGDFDVASTDETEHAIRLKAANLPLGMFRFLAARAYGDLRFGGQLTSDVVWQPATVANGADEAASKHGPQSLRGQIGVTDLFVSGGPFETDEVRLKNVSLQSDVQLTSDEMRAKELNIDCDVGRVSAKGYVKTTMNGKATPLAALARGKYDIQASLDLARLAQMLPRTLSIRTETQVTGGVVRLDLVSQPSAEGHLWQASLKTEGLSATNRSKPIRLEKPIAIDLAARETGAGVTVDALECSSDFLQISGKGTADELTAELLFDLDQLKSQLGQLVDLGDMQIAGEGRAELRWQRDKTGVFRTTTTAELKRFELGPNAASVWREKDLKAELQATGRMPANAIERLDSATLRAVASGQRGKGDLLKVDLREPVTKLIGLDRLPLLIHCSGDVAAWRTRLAPFVDLSGWDLGGTADAHANVTWTPAACEVHSLKGAIQQLHVWSSKWFIDEPIVQFEMAGRYDLASRRVELSGTTIESSTASVRSERASIALSTAGSLGLLGEVTFLADLEKLERWTRHPQRSAALVWAGQLNGRADLALNGDETSARLEAKVDNLAATTTAPAAAAGAPKPANPLRSAGITAQPASRVSLWTEKQLAVAFRGTYSRSTDAVRMENLQIGSEALKLQAAGQIDHLNGKADLSLRGRAEYNWDTLSKLVAPYFGNNVRIEGRDSRTFAIRGPIGELFNTGAPTSVAGASRQSADPLAWIKPLSAQASAGWEKADVFGMRVDQGEITAQLNDGLLRINPIELAVSGGRVRLSPQVLLTPTPAELILDRGKVIEQVRVTPEMAASWLKYIAPAVAEATQTEGQLSLDLDGAKVPLARPASADIAGKLSIHSLQVTPGPPARAVILLAEQIRALIDKRPPPLELGHNPVLLSISEQQIDFRMADGRVHHQGMTMSVGDVTIRTHGWVALDETIGLTAEVPIKPQWVQRNPLLASLKDKTLQIPIGGTLRRPQVDPRAMQQVASLLLENTARDLLQEQLDKQLNRLFQPRERK